MNKQTRPARHLAVETAPVLSNVTDYGPGEELWAEEKLASAQHDGKDAVLVYIGQSFADRIDDPGGNVAMHIVTTMKAEDALPKEGEVCEVRTAGGQLLCVVRKFKVGYVVE